VERGKLKRYSPIDAGGSDESAFHSRASQTLTLPHGQRARRQPPEIGTAVAFLRSDAASYIGDRTMLIDAGWHDRRPTPDSPRIAALLVWRERALQADCRNFTQALHCVTTVLGTQVAPRPAERRRAAGGNPRRVRVAPAIHQAETRAMISDSLLKSVYLFADLGADERGRLAKIAEAMSLQAGVQIFQAGDEATALYLIKEGSVRITTLSPSGERIDVATLASGSHFGEMALIDGAKRSASAATLEPTSIFRFDYDRIRALLEGSPPIASKFYRALARFLSNRLRQTTTDMSFARERTCDISDRIAATRPPDRPAAGAEDRM
jgi:CRP/FNR family transcriptional regulator, cyclic AMP receptor protein